MRNYAEEDSIVCVDGEILVQAFPLDEIMKGRKCTFLKIDVEGYEPQVLEGMRQTLEANPQAVLLICVYHKLQEEEEIRRLLEPYHS